MILSALLVPVAVSGQTTFKADPDLAKDFFSKGNYMAALKVYQLLLKKEPENVEYNQNIAKCYLLANTIREKAIPHLEFLIKQEKYPDDVWLDLGTAYHYAKRFPDAINAYNKYKAKVMKDKKAVEVVDRLIEQCHNGATLVKRPLNVTFENLGKTFNSEQMDYFPIVMPDESAVFFTTRRKGGGAQAEFDGLFPSDIYYAAMKDGKMGKAQTVGALINTPLDEQIVDISDDGMVMLFYIDHNVGGNEQWGDIWIARRLNSKAQWLKPEPMPDNINAGFETSASIYRNAYTEEEILLIASSRPSSTENPNFGETDIYMSKRLPTGAWSEPRNLGPNINTKFKEEFPQLSEDGKTLYFASQGHSSMGGFDIFKSVWDEDSQTWSAPKNLGYPINTPGNDFNISFTTGGRIAYTSTLREGGMGDLDVYRLVLQDVEAKETVYHGYISSTDTLAKIRNVRMEIIDKNTEELQGVYLPDPNSCYFVLAIPPGKWTLKITADGYQDYSENINIFDEVLKFSPEIKKNIKLSPK